jgi:hypothetical protein
MSKTTTRRAILAGIAAAPALALSGAGPDPIFAAIERHRAALAAHLKTIEAQGDLEERLCDERLAEAGSPTKCSQRWHEAIDAANRDPRYVRAEEISGRPCHETRNRGLDRPIGI